MGMLLAAVHVIGILISGEILNIPVRDVMIRNWIFIIFMNLMILIPIPIPAETEFCTGLDFYHGYDSDSDSSKKTELQDL